MLDWNTDRLGRELDAWLPGAAVQVLSQCGSTNTVLLERARQADGPFTPCLLVAEEQTAGRGRLGRGWWSQAGTSLTFSLALPLAASDWSGLSLAVGLAVAEALDEFEPAAGTPGGARRGPAIALKWPNDLWLVGAPAGARQPADAPAAPGRKLGGILIETVNRGPQRIAVIGIGLNIQPLAPGHAAALGREVGCLQQLDPAATAPLALARVAGPLARALRRFGEAGFAAFAAGYARRDALRGRPVTTTDARAPAGMAEGVADDGALLVRSGGRLHRISSGEVSVRPLEAGVSAAAAVTSLSGPADRAAAGSPFTGAA